MGLFPAQSSSWICLSVAAGSTLGSFSVDDGEGNVNANKTEEKDLKSKTASHFFVHFLAVNARLRREILLCGVLCSLCQFVPGSQIVQWERIKTSKAKKRRARLGKGGGVSPPALARVFRISYY